jgi:hypothetical protein
MNDEMTDKKKEMGKECRRNEGRRQRNGRMGILNYFVK